MKRIVLLIAALLYLAVPATAIAATPSAFNPLNQACTPVKGGTTPDSSACKTDGSNPITGSNGVLMKVSLVLSIIAGVAAVIIIIVGGMQYITSGGDPQKAASARNMITGALIGLVIIAAAGGIITFVVSKL